MAVIPLKSAELGRWRLAIEPAAARLRFRIDLTLDEPSLVTDARDAEPESEVETMVARAMIEIDRDLAPDVANRLASSNAAVIIAVALRDRLLDLLWEDSQAIRSRGGALEAINAAHAYGQALGAVIKTIIESEGPTAVRALAERRQCGVGPLAPPKA